MDRKELDFKIMSGMAWMPLQLLAGCIGISVKKLRRIFCKFSREVMISNDGDLIKIEDKIIYLNEKCVYMLLAWSNELHIDNIADIQSDFHEALEEHMEKEEEKKECPEKKECKGKCKRECEKAHDCHNYDSEEVNMKIVKIDGKQAEHLLGCIRELLGK